MKQFVFENEAEVMPEAARLTVTIEQYGIPYIRSLASYGALLPRLREEVHRFGGAAEKYVAALYLSGDIQGAFRFLDGHVARCVSKGTVGEVVTLKKLKLHLEAQSSRDR